MYRLRILWRRLQQWYRAPLTVAEQKHAFVRGWRFNYARNDWERPRRDRT
jgi:hypothetical protein